MKVVIYMSPEERALGLQHKPTIEPDTLFVFPYIHEGNVFHSRNVSEPFDLAFIGPDRHVLWKGVVVPTGGIAIAPPGTAMALEAKQGWLSAYGYEVGRYAAF